MKKDYIIQQNIDELYYKKCLESPEYRNIKKEEFLRRLKLFNMYYYPKKFLSKISEIVRICHDLNLTLKDLKEDCKKFNGSEDEE
jgi:hypothetical protein